jgi:sugar-specific transcriptional regulator TrmB
MTGREKPDFFTAKASGLVLLSDRILGDPKEIDAVEAEELLQAANIDPQELKARFHRRFDNLAREYAAKGQRVPLLLKQALADLRPGVSRSRAERELLREAQAAVRNLLKRATQLPRLLAKIPNFTLAAAYRNKKELSERDKKLLDDVARNLANHKKNGKAGRRAKGGV